MDANIFRQIELEGIVPVIKIDDANDAIPLAKALVNGGLHCAEVTFRTSAAKEAISLITQNVPEILVGAGTVLTTEQVDQAMKAGAKFIVSPGLNENIVKYCQEHDYPILPGVCSPSEIEKGLALGLTKLKFFPAEPSGGLKMIKALAAPYTTVRFMPTGGINELNLTDYLSNDKIFACGGSWMVKSELIKNGAYDQITALSKAAVKSMHNFQLKHLGINSDNDTEAVKNAKILCNLFDLDVVEHNKSCFAGSLVEFMKGEGRGTHGHIGISCNSVDRAKVYLEHKGIVFDDSSAAYTDDGHLKIIYFKDEIAGFAIHLISK